jgi:lysophospholipase L1-like esterase
MVHRLPWLARLCLISVSLLAGAITLPRATAGEFPQVGRIVFLGDSITHAGGYVQRLETAMRLQLPQRQVEFLNLGLPSETVSGLSEPGHAGGQFPRPVLGERLDRILQQTKPDLVVACYGMNDGIYYPLSKDRMAKFQEGIEELHRKVEASGAGIIHLTPAFFDAHPIQDRLLPAGLDEYRQPYAGYDEVLEAYSNWLLEQQSRGWKVIDLHGAMKQAVLDRRKIAPDFTFAADGVHPNEEGQAVVAGPLSKEWGLQLDDQGKPQVPQGKSIDVDRLFQLVAQKQRLLQLAWLTATGHLRPGIPQGVSLQQASQEASQLDQQINQMTR